MISLTLTLLFKVKVIVKYMGLVIVKNTTMWVVNTGFLLNYALTGKLKFAETNIDPLQSFWDMKLVHL